MTKKKTQIKHKYKKDVKKEDMTVRILLEKNLMFLAMYSLVFSVLIGSLFSFDVGKQSQIHGSNNAEYVLSAQDVQLKTLPHLKPTQYLTFPILSAQGVYVLDIESGKALFQKNPDYPLLPASTVKMTTALVALETYDLDRVVIIGEGRVEGQKMGLVPGEGITVKNLIAGLLIYSANDAAEALANAHPDGRTEFIRLMNHKASELGLKNTKYDNPSGLDGVTQLTSAHDLSIVAMSGLNNYDFAHFVKQKTYTVDSVDGAYSHYLKNTNVLLGEVDGVLGIKTGWTENARENLVTYVERDNRNVIFVILGSQDRFGETEELIEWIYDNYEWIEPGNSLSSL